MMKNFTLGRIRQILSNQQGGSSIMDFIESVVAVVVVGTIVGTYFGTGFNIGTTISDGLGGGSTIGAFSIGGEVGTGVMSFLPLPLDLGGSGGGSTGGNDTTVDHTAPNLVGTKIDGGTSGDTHTIYQVDGQTTLSEDKVKMGAILTDPAQSSTNSSQYTDSEGGTWKTAKQLAAEHDTYLQQRAKDAVATTQSQQSNQKSGQSNTASGDSGGTDISNMQWDFNNNTWVPVNSGAGEQGQ